MSRSAEENVSFTQEGERWFLAKAFEKMNIAVQTISLRIYVKVKKSFYVLFLRLRFTCLRLHSFINPFWKGGIGLLQNGLQGEGYKKVNKILPILLTFLYPSPYSPFWMPKMEEVVKRNGKYKISERKNYRKIWFIEKYKDISIANEFVICAPCFMSV